MPNNDILASAEDASQNSSFLAQVIGSNNLSSWLILVDADYPGVFELNELSVIQVVPEL